MYRILSEEDYKKEYQLSVKNPELFWEEKAANFSWHRKWDSVLEWNFNNPDVKWFNGAKLNITENCLDRHLENSGNKTAIIWEPNNPNEKAINITYSQLHALVNKFANALKNNGVKKGDRVCIYMPMVPELAIAVLACARIGAIHSVVFGGFSFSSLADRINDAQCNLVITADGAYRGQKEIPLKPVVDEALLHCPSVKKTIVLKRSGSQINMQSGRDIWWDDAVKNTSENCISESMDAEDMLFILYTSGSTGKPKGVVHTCGGYMVYTGYTFLNVFQYNQSDVFCCTAD